MRTLFGGMSMAGLAALVGVLALVLMAGVVEEQGEQPDCSAECDNVEETAIAVLRIVVSNVNSASATAQLQEQALQRVIDSAADRGVTVVLHAGSVATVSRVVEQQGFTCEVLFDDAKLAVVSLAKREEPGGGSRKAGYWVVFDQPAELGEVVSAVRRAWWMGGHATFAANEPTECELAVRSTFGVDSHDEVATVRMIRSRHVGVQDETVAEVRVVGSVWKGQQRRLVGPDSSGQIVLPFDADDESIQGALAVAMAASTGAEAYE